MNRPIRAAVAAVTMLVMLLASAGQASAQETSDVYVIHGIPGVDVDVYVNGDLTLENFQPKDIAGPLTLPAADYDIEIFAHEDGAPAASSERTDDAVIDVSPAVPGGENVSVIAHLAEDGTPTLSAFVNDLEPAGAGNGRVTIRHTAAAPTVDIVAGGAAVDPLTGISNGNEAKADLPADSYPTGIAAAGTTEALLDAPVTVVEGENLVVYAIGDLSAGSVELLTQNFTGLHSTPTAVNSGNSGLRDAPAASLFGGWNLVLLTMALLSLGGAVISFNAGRAEARRLELPANLKR